MIIDLTFTIQNNMLTCGTDWHQKVEIKSLGTIGTVGRNTSSYLLGSHTGTHMDAPRHFFDEGRGIDEILVQELCGEITIVDFCRFGKGKVIQPNDIDSVVVTPKMLFVFGWCKYWNTEQYYKDYPFFSVEVIRYLIKKGMKFMAMDTPSPDCIKDIYFKNESMNHKLLLKNGVILLEYVANTDMIDFDKQYEIISLPLKILGGDGAPCRVILRQIL